MTHLDASFGTGEEVKKTGDGGAAGTILVDWVLVCGFQSGSA